MPVQGIDLSGWNKPQDWSEAKAAGIEFAFVKVSQGLYGSRRSRKHFTDLGRAGILRGGYHFANLKYKGRLTPRKQAEKMVARLEAIGEWELPPVLDFEWQTYPGETASERKAARVEDIGKGSHKFPHTAVVDWALEFGSRCYVLTGMLPILYTGDDFWEYRMGFANLAGWLLWEIDYIDSQPEPPAFKTSSPFTPTWDKVDFWQWTGQKAPWWYKGRRLDRNLFNGSLELLQGLVP